MTDYYARVDYEYDGGDTYFTIPFDYIKKAHINVYVNDVETENYTYNTSTQISIDDELTSGDIISIRRTTPIDEKMVVYSNTSILDEEALNLANDQFFNAVQEVYDYNTINAETLSSLESTVDESLTSMQSTIDELSDNFDTWNEELYQMQQGNDIAYATELTNGVVKLAAETSLSFFSGTGAVTSETLGWVLTTMFKWAYYDSENVGYKTNLYTQSETESLITSSLEDYYTSEETDTLLADKANTSDLAAVALSGSYTDLSDTPSNVSEFTNDTGYLTEVPDEYITSNELTETLTNYLTEIPDEYVTESELTTALSAKQDTLTFDTAPTEGSTNPVTSGGIYTALCDYSTTDEMNSTILEDLAYYNLIAVPDDGSTDSGSFEDETYTLESYASNVYTKDETDEAIANAVSTLDLSSVSVDLSDYYTKDETDSAIASAVSTIDVSSLEVDLSNYYTKTETDSAISAAIPTTVSSFTNDAGYLTEDEVNTLITTAIGEIENGSY